MNLVPPIYGRSRKENLEREMEFICSTTFFSPQLVCPMSTRLSDFIPDFTRSLVRILRNENYLLKGGQALLYHIRKYTPTEDARYSRDIVISLSSENFPLAIDKFKAALIKDYNFKFFSLVEVYVGVQCVYQLLRFIYGKRKRNDEI